MYKELAPIALFVYNRPEHTKKTIEALQRNQEASQSVLYVFSDAERSDRDQLAVNETRAYVKQIKGFKDVKIIERAHNWGLADSIIDGVTMLCEDYGSVIVLEDDLIVSPHFLAYMNDGLVKYESESRVMQVAGYMFPVDLNEIYNSLFLPFPTSWGWATWKSSWDKFDRKAMAYEQLKNNASLIKRFNLDGHYNYFQMLERYMNGKVNSWAIRWHLTVFTNNGLVVYPPQTLVNNIGFDGSGVNCIASTIAQSDLNSDAHGFNFPNKIELSEGYNKVIAAIPKQTLTISTILNYIMIKIKNLFNFN